MHCIRIGEEKKPLLPLACAAPAMSALFFPVQPRGSWSRASRRLYVGKSASDCAGTMAEWSLTTMI